MLAMTRIKTIVVAGGTHGNELSGVMLHRKWQGNESLYAEKCPSANVELVLSNPEATAACKRYVERDLNRSFANRLLRLENPAAYEIRRAKELNAKFGPKGKDSRTDLLIDVHNTTSNMGCCLILSARDPFTMRASAEIVHESRSLTHLPVKIYYQPEERGESPYFGTVAKADICLEIGPQPHGAMNYGIFSTAERVVSRYLELAEAWNRGTLQALPKKTVEVYTQYKDIDYPRDKFGNVRAMIHPDVSGKDYAEVKPESPLFISFDGKDIPNGEGHSTWPIFIDESAYYEKMLAMSLTLKTTEEW